MDENNGMALSNEEILIRETDKYHWFQALDRTCVIQDNFYDNVMALEVVECSEVVRDKAEQIMNELGDLASLIIQEEERIKKIRKAWKKNKGNR